MSWRLHIEYSCPNCGCGFSSLSNNPRFCCRACALQYRGCSDKTRQKLSDCAKNQWGTDRIKLLEALAKRDLTKTVFRVKQLWKSDEFRKKIQTSRRLKGYPDKNRPEAVAKRKLRIAAKNFIRRCLFSKDGRSSFYLLGYTCQQLREHIEAHFKDDMAWQNYGLWEIDHVFPISRFPADAPIAVINALDNLQPLWKVDNRRKWNSVIAIPTPL